MMGRPLAGDSTQVGRQKMIQIHPLLDGPFREASALNPGEIQVWRVSLAATPARERNLKAGLSAGELRQADGFHFAADQRRFIVRRAVLRCLLSAVLDLPPNQIRYVVGVHGKPALPNHLNPKGIRFSCTHSGDWALIALAVNGELGLDLEMHREIPEVQALTQSHFSAGEVAELTALPLTRQITGFFNGWSRKEAFVKAIGVGLSYPLSHFTVSLMSAHGVVPLAVADDAAMRRRWTLVSLELLEQFSAALVFEANQATAIRCLAWDGD